MRDDRKTGRGILEHNIDFRSDYTDAVISINKAYYGYMPDLSKVIDVTTRVQAIVTGRKLFMKRGFDSILSCNFLCF